MANWRQTAKRVIQIEKEALAYLSRLIDKDFDKACDLILASKGRVILTGLGKPGFIAQKISATLSSTGTPSLFLHPAEALHGDVGRVMSEDVVIALSNSGQTEEIVRLLPLLKKIGTPVIGMTGNPRSSLAKHSDCVLNTSVRKEACPMNLAPTASTTAMLAMGDALAVALLEKKGFGPKDFAFFHPGGNLGKKLLKVSDIMRRGSSNPVVRESMKVREVLLRITRARAGSASVVGSDGKLRGIFTDGDLRRFLKEGNEILDKPVSSIMTRNPVVIESERLAAQALEIMRSRKIDEVPVVDKFKKPVGLLDVQDLLRAGVV